MTGKRKDDRIDPPRLADTELAIPAFASEIPWVSRRTFLTGLPVSAVPFDSLGNTRQPSPGVETLGASVGPQRRVKFRGRLTSGTRNQSTWRAVAFRYADYNAFYYTTDALSFDEFTGERFSITTTVPYSNHSFPYFAFLLEDDTHTFPEILDYPESENPPGPRGAEKTVFVPSTADTLQIKTVDAIPFPNEIAVEGRIEDYGAALDITAGAGEGEQIDEMDNIVNYSYATEKQPGDDPRFAGMVTDLEPDTEYTVFAVAEVPAGPVSDSAFGEPLTVRTTVGDETNRIRPLRITTTDELSGIHFAITGNADSYTAAGISEHVDYLTNTTEFTEVRLFVTPDNSPIEFDVRGALHSLSRTGNAEITFASETIDPAHTIPASDVTALDFPEIRGKTRLRIDHTGCETSLVGYDFTVASRGVGPVSGTQTGEMTIDSNRVYGYFGPTAGHLEVSLSTHIREFVLIGPGVVSVDGTIVNPRE